MKNQLTFLFLLLFTAPFYGQIHSYYNGLDLTKVEHELFLDLSERLKSTHIAIPYTASSTDTWDVLKLADEDPAISSNVVLFYGFNDSDGNSETDRSRAKTETDSGGGDRGKWNREHVFPKSLASPNLGTEEPGPGTDVHNLRAADADRNANRSNRKFADGTGNSGVVVENGGWYPGDEWKGDVARILMYMYLRYDGDGSKVSETKCIPIDVGFGVPMEVDAKMLDVFLRWNVEDPVSQFESDRNEVIASTQGNRNPFIDNPYLASLIWGGLNAEDKWNINTTNDNELPTVPTSITLSNLTHESVKIMWNASSDNIEVVDYLIYLNGEYLQTSMDTSAMINGLTENTTYKITIKARDRSSNLSIESEELQIETLDGPIVLYSETFTECTGLNFVSINEASDKNWTCSDQNGENNSGSMQINGYQQNELSKDWLITVNAIDFDISSGERLSFYADASYGDSLLELVFSNDYNGSGNPQDFSWSQVPNSIIPLHSNGSGSEEVFNFSNVDISEISGSVFFAFRYYANQNPTRWTVDSFEITAEEIDDDIDKDGVLNEQDLCPNTAEGAEVDENGCAEEQRDDDNDGVLNPDDECPDTIIGSTVASNGCAIFTLSSDNFTIESIGESCPGKNNGQIRISANEEHGYIAKINGTVHNFLDSLIVDNLTPGNYTICISVENENYEQCFDLYIDEGINVAGKASVKAGKVQVEMDSGTAPFTVFVGGIERFKTFASDFNLDVSHGDLVQVKTAVDCEGVFEKTVNLIHSIVAYPNPSKGVFEIALPVVQNEVIIELYSLEAKLLSSKNYPVVYGKATLNIEDLPKGIYLVMVQLDKPVLLKVIKD